MWPDEVEIYTITTTDDGFNTVTGRHVAACRISNNSEDISDSEGVMHVSRFSIVFPSGVDVDHHNRINITRMRGANTRNQRLLQGLQIKAIRPRGIGSLRYMTVMC